MGIYRRPDSPFWWLWLERPGQRSIRESSGIPLAGGTPGQARQNRELAEQAYAARMGDLARQRYQLPTERPRITFAQYRAWYNEHVSRHKRGADREASMFRQLGQFFDDRRLDEITKDLALEWRTARRQTVGPATINREQELLVHVLNTAVPKHLEAHVDEFRKRFGRDPRGNKTA